MDKRRRSPLAETVLRHIRSGSTQIKAFDEVGDTLNRTSAACGFRWNAEVRPNYEDAVQLAKQRKELKRSEAKIEKEHFTKTKQLVIDAEFSEDITPSKQELTMQNIISFLQNLEHTNPSLAKLQTENDVLQAQLTSLQKRMMNSKQN